ncbi:voltage-dependent anion channel [Talaromyces proteolyticus]|uniref:Voltage-dependent anion channel n=1 Tax=Talaromyces proteolyticus TaxID=1131652 RepID=A0AAD4KT54_9EURO|nr:voltage-dependent anion channel [Talaromyces proteolyticus]KAH8698732.1 voltage-dependent anion channel [Talaromyces proteolyticus]
MEKESSRWKDRLKYFTWSFFTLTMATGGISNLLYNGVFTSLTTIGVVIMLFNIFSYVLTWSLLITRFCYYPRLFKESFLHPTESLFVPSAMVAFETILINISQYGLDRTGQWLTNLMFVVFWVDIFLAIATSVGIYVMLWTTQTFAIAEMTPIWIFPAYPMLLVGPYVGNLYPYLDPLRSALVVVAGFTVQGIGYLVSLTVYSAFIYRLMTHKLPSYNIRPGMFISIGPSAFTAEALVSMAADAQQYIYTGYMGVDSSAVAIVRLLANFVSLWFWGAAIFFFFIATCSHAAAIVGRNRMTFSMTWFSFIFPNTALISATFAIGKAFSCKPIQIIGLVWTISLVLLYIFVCFMMVRAVKLRHILWEIKS